MGALPHEWPLPHAWKPVWQKNEERIALDPEDGSLRFNIVPNCHGLESGAAFRANPHGCLPADSAQLSYTVYFPPEFNFVKGGKLPGFNIGCNENDNSSGGEWTEGCGSFRIMFRERGAAIGYAYPCLGDGQRSFDAQGDAFKAVAKVKGGAGIDMWHTKDDNEDCMLVPGQWNTVEMHLKLNTPGQADGSASITVNGKTKSCDGMVWRSDDQPKINALNFVAFFGGGSDEWNSPTDTWMKFKDVSFSAN